MPTVPDNTDYNNSHAAKQAAAKATPAPEPEREVKKIVEGTVLVRKQPLHKRLMKSFFGADDAAGVVSYIATDVVVPGLKDLISDAATGAIERALFGESSGRLRRSRGSFNGGGPITNYSGISTRAMQQQAPQARMSPQAREQHNFTEITLGNRIDAENVLISMQAALEQFQIVTVAELYALVGYEVSFQDRKWGWEGQGALNGARPVRVKNGFFLDLPAPSYIQ